MTKQVKITDVSELQNLLDDFSPDRPYLNAYDIEDGVYASEAELEAWRRKGKITTRVEARSATEPETEIRYTDPFCYHDGYYGPGDACPQHGTKKP